MNKLFLKAFGFLMLSIVATALVCNILSGMVNTVREMDYKTQRVTPLFNWLASTSTHASLAGKSRQLSQFSLQIIPLSESALSSLAIERLSYGQVVVSDQSDGSTRVNVQYGPKHTLETEFVNFYQDSAYLTEQIVIHWLLNTSAPKREAAFVQASKMLGVKLTMMDVVDKTLPQMVLDGLAAKNRAIYWPDVTQAASYFIRLKDGLVYRIDFPKPFDPLSWPVLLMLLVVSVGCIGVTVFIMLSTVDQRLKRLETVATRISRGELDARMKVEKNDEIGRLGDAFNRMAEHIQRLVDVQKEMIHAVSHELRTPVARIRFGVQMIEDCQDETSRHKQLKGIDGDIQELDELIDEILTYARLEQGGPILIFHNTNIKAVVEQVVMEQSGVKPDMSITAQFSEGSDQWTMSEVEERYIHRSIQNLVGNASRYAKSKVNVVCQFDRETCRVDVEDDGPGIPEEDWDSVFTPFARLDDSRTRASGGYGLGLSIVRRILYWHGGQAFLGRSVMGGAKFSLVWPRLQASKSED